MSGPSFKNDLGSFTGELLIESSFGSWFALSTNSVQRKTSKDETESDRKYSLLPQFSIIS